VYKEGKTSLVANNIEEKKVTIRTAINFIESG
jgi:hypothetical protein